MKIGHTRAMVRALLSGALERVETRPDPVFGLQIPTSVADVPAEVLFPRNTWKDGAAYDAQAAKLAQMFRTNFEKFGEVDAAVVEAGPRG
jgi:phosphoenolpyruvate carboxykinase (ATP)